MVRPFFLFKTILVFLFSKIKKLSFSKILFSCKKFIFFLKSVFCSLTLFLTSERISFFNLLNVCLNFLSVQWVLKSLDQYSHSRFHLFIDKFLLSSIEYNFQQSLFRIKLFRPQTNHLLILYFGCFFTIIGEASLFITRFFLSLNFIAKDGKQNFIFSFFLKILYSERIFFHSSSL